MQSDAVDESTEQSSRDPAQPVDAPSANPEVRSDLTAQDGVANLAEQLASRIESAVDRGASRVLEAFEAKLAYDATKQLQVDRLHEELQQYRSDLATRTARPLFHGMIQLHDDIGKLHAALRNKPETELSPERFFKLLEGLREDVEILLRQNGVAAYREVGSSFDPRRQKVLRKVGTGDESLAGKVAESMRPGFEHRGEILEKERVATYDLQPVQQPARETSSE